MMWKFQFMFLTWKTDAHTPSAPCVRLTPIHQLTENRVQRGVFVAFVLNLLSAAAENHLCESNYSCLNLLCLWICYLFHQAVLPDERQNVNWSEAALHFFSFRLFWNFPRRLGFSGSGWTGQVLIFRWGWSFESQPSGSVPVAVLTSVITFCIVCLQMQWVTLVFNPPRLWLLSLLSLS